MSRATAIRDGVQATLSAKWGTPEISRIYPRERLFKRLDELRPFACTWVAAPAGYGKTCLLRSYLERTGPARHWYTLDRSDSDVATFFSDFSAGLKAAIPSAPLLQYSSDVQDPAAFARAYFKLAFASLPGPQLLVLDDYQELLPDSPLHLVIPAMIGVLPGETRLLVLSRGAPPSALARAQTYDLVALVEADRLRLTADEAMGIARLRRPEQDFDEQDVLSLLDRADGWAAGFVLLLRHPADAASPSEVLFDYFAREVLEGADPELRDFLLLTAWLPSMTAGMAQRLTGRPKVEPLLRALLQGNYPVSRTSAQDPVYRYHQLFRLFLRQHALAAWTQDERLQCQRRAAAVLEEAGQLDAAVGLWCDVADWDGVTGLIRRAAPPLLEQARTQSLEKWLDAIPPGVMTARPWLRYWSGRSRLHRDPIAARQCFEQAYGGFKAQADESGVFLSWAGVCETYWIALDGTEPLKHWLAELEAIQTRWPSFPSAEIEAGVGLGAFYGLIANDPAHPSRERWENRLLDALASDLPADLRLTIANLLMFHYVMTMGDRGRAALVLDRLRVLVENDATAPLSVVIARSWGDFAYAYVFGGSSTECRAIAEDAQSMAADRNVHLYDFVLSSMPTISHLTAGRADAARPYLENLLAILDWSRLYDRGYFYWLRAWEAWLDGRLTESYEAARTAHPIAERFGDLHAITGTAIALFKIEAARGNTAEALRHLGSIRSWLRRVRSAFISFQRALALAELTLQLERPARCRRLLRTAYAIGREQGYVRIPFFKPQTQAHLCAMALDAGIEVDYVSDLIRKLGLAPPGDAPLTEQWPWPIKVRTLGDFALRVDGTIVVWPRKAQQKPVDLLRALIAYGGRGVAVSKLVDELWPDALGDAAAKALKTTLHRLRKILRREDAVLLRDGKLSLNPACVWVDTWALEQLFGELAPAVSATDYDRGLETLETTAARLVGLYKGPFLDGSDLPCAAPLREALHRKFFLAIERLGAAFEAIGMSDRARDCYTRGLDLDPTAERIRRKLTACAPDG